MRLTRLLREMRVDVLNVHYVTTSAFTFALMRRAGLFRGRLILSYHGSDLDDLAGMGTIESGLTTWMLRTADAVVAVSSQMARMLPWEGAKVVMAPWMPRRCAHWLPGAGHSSRFRRVRSYCAWRILLRRRGMRACFAPLPKSPAPMPPRIFCWPGGTGLNAVMLSRPYPNYGLRTVSRWRWTSCMPISRRCWRRQRRSCWLPGWRVGFRSQSSKLELLAFPSLRRVSAVSLKSLSMRRTDFGGLRRHPGPFERNRSIAG